MDVQLGDAESVFPCRNGCSYGFHGGGFIKRIRLILMAISFLAWCAIPLPGTCGEPSVSPVPALAGQWITALTAGTDGIWVGTATGQVTFLRPTGEVVRTYGPSDGLPPGKVNSVAVQDGAVYAGSEQGVAVLDGAAWKIIPSAEGKPLKNVFLRAETTGKGLWAGALDLSGGLLRLEGKRWQIYGGRGAGLMNHIQAFAFQGDTVWLGSVSSGVFSKKGDEFRTFRAKDGLPSGTVYALEIFGESVWAGTSAGPARYAAGKWTAYRKMPSLPLSAVFCLASAPDALYLGGPEGLVRHRKGKFEPFAGTDPSRKIGRVNALLFHEGVLYEGGTDGLLRIEGW